MFEDLIGPKRPKTLPSDNSPTASIADQVCPICGSTDIENISGGFSNSNCYFSAMICIDCRGKWTVEYDSDLNIINVDIEG
jgi:hypothetical protein